LKPLNFFEAFRQGFLLKYQWKILYIYLDSIPPEYINDGWLAEAFLRNVMSSNALARLKGVTDEDLFLSFDADEIPKAEVLQFLKLHSGFGNPVQFNMRWSVYRYYWAHLADGQRTNPST
jgi:beta-1,4-mannosyl-glycoprotein beta-1,4-N-acetylglucosaminyltransferase